MYFYAITYKDTTFVKSVINTLLLYLFISKNKFI